MVEVMREISPQGGVPRPGPEEGQKDAMIRAHAPNRIDRMSPMELRERVRSLESQRRVHRKQITDMNQSIRSYRLLVEDMIDRLSANAHTIEMLREIKGAKRGGTI